MRKRFLGISLSVVLGLSTLFVAGCGHQHTWVEATCTEPKTCSECGETEGEPLGHTWVEATCTEPKTCSVCNETEGDALGHTVAEWTVTVEPTCSTEGEQTGECSVCEETVIEAIPTTDHVGGEWVITQDATSSTPGIRTQYCEVCGEEIATEEFELSDEELEADFKEKCEEYTYEEIARDPDNYMLTYGKYTGEVIQVMEDGDTVQLRVNITPTSYGYTDTIYVEYTRKEGESRILEDDIITIYGINFGTVSYESVMGATITIPAVLASYIDID